MRTRSANLTSMVGTVCRSTREGFELHLPSPLDCVLSQRPHAYKPEPFTPFRRPRAPLASDALNHGPKAELEGHRGTCDPSGGLPAASSPAVLVTGPAAPHTWLGSKSPDSEAGKEALPSPDVSGDIAIPAHTPPGAAHTGDAETMLLLAKVAKFYGGRLPQELPRSVQAEIDYVSRFSIRDKSAHASRIAEAFKKPKSSADLRVITKALDGFVTQLRDLRQGLADAVVSPEHVDFLLEVLSSREVLKRVYIVLKRVLCDNHDKHVDGAREYGESVIDALFEATDLHSRNKSEDGAPRQGFVVHFLFKKYSFKHGKSTAEIDTEFDKLDAILDDLSRIECPDKRLVEKLVRRLTVSKNGKVIRSPTSDRGTAVPGSSSKAPEIPSRSLSSPALRRGVVHPKADPAEAAMRKALANSSPQTAIDLDGSHDDQKEKRSSSRAPLVVRDVGKYQDLNKCTYEPMPASRTSILSRARSKTPFSRISFSGPVSAVEIEHFTDRCNYDGCDPLRPVDEDHEGEIRSRCKLLSRRACLARAMERDYDIFIRMTSLEASGALAEKIQHYRMQLLNP